MSTPSPQRCTQVHDAAFVDRDLDCRHYDACLDVAARENWAAFSCRACPLRGKARAGELDVGAYLGGPGNIEAEQHRPARKLISSASPAKGGFYLEVFARFTPERPTWRAGELAAAMGQPAGQVMTALVHLVGRGQLERVGRGVFAIPERSPSCAEEREGRPT